MSMNQLFQQYMGIDDGVTVLSVSIRTDGGVEFQYYEPGDLQNNCVHSQSLVVPVDAVDLVDLIDTFRRALHDAETYRRAPKNTFRKGESE